jgi:hypothetical protein
MQIYVCVSVCLCVCVCVCVYVCVCASVWVICGYFQCLALEIRGKHLSACGANNGIVFSRAAVFSLSPSCHHLWCGAPRSDDTVLRLSLHMLGVLSLCGAGKCCLFKSISPSYGGRLNYLPFFYYTYFFQHTYSVYFIQLNTSRFIPQLKVLLRLLGCTAASLPR